MKNEKQNADRTSQVRSVAGPSQETGSPTDTTNPTTRLRQKTTLASKGSGVTIRPEIKSWWDSFVYKIKGLTPKWLSGIQLVKH